MIKVAPSILSIDFTQFDKQIRLLNDTNATYLHFDVMDGHFVNNLTFGPKILEDVKKMSDLVMDVHIMVSNPREVYPWFVEANADIITFHYEAMESADDANDLIRQMHASGVCAGLSIKPNTPVSAIESCLKHVDLVLVMSVEPGFGGQSFMMNALDKIEQLDKIRKEHNYDFLIEVDGGINAETGLLCKEKNADVLVAGSYVFKGDISKNIDSLI